MTSVSPDSSSIADTYTGRAVPWSQEAEQAVLGAMLLDQDAALLATELVQDDMFYRESHRRLFRAMVGLVERRTVIDPVTLRDVHPGTPYVSEEILPEPFQDQSFTLQAGVHLTIAAGFVTLAILP